MFYNYIYLDPRKSGRYCYEGLNFSLLFEPFYVGKGKLGKRGERKFAHLKEARVKHSSSHPKIAKIQSIWKTGLQPLILQINSNLENSIALNIEIDIISKIGRKDLYNGVLLNMTDGGEVGPIRYGKENGGGKLWNSLSDEDKVKYRNYISNKTKLAIKNRSKERQEEIYINMCNSLLKLRCIYEIIDSFKNTTVILSSTRILEKYCKDNNLHYQSLYDFTRGRFFKYNPNSTKHKMYKEAILYTMNYITISRIKK